MGRAGTFAAVPPAATVAVRHKESAAISAAGLECAKNEEEGIDEISHREAG